MNLHKYTLEELKEAVKSSGSIRQTLIKLGVAPYGGNYDVFRKAVKHYGISTEHFHGQLWHPSDNTGIMRKSGEKRRRKLKDILTEDSHYQSSKLRQRLIEEGLKERKCESCGLTEWMGQEISLELDHINGTRTDNRIENLRILCPNCHSQTPTYRGRNKKNKTLDP